MLPFQGAGAWFIIYPKAAFLFHLPKAASFQDFTLGWDMIGFQPEDLMQKITK